MIKRLILHIGTVKTGTTAIQRFLYHNRERLGATGVGIPVQTDGYRLRNGNGVLFARNGYFLLPLVLAKTMHAASEQPGNVEKAHRDAARFKEIMACHDAVVLSDEDFSLWGPRQKGFWLILRDLLHNLGVERTEFVVYLRRQDRLAASWWLQRIKTSGFYAERFEHYLNGPIRTNLHYNTWLVELENVFGPENVTVRRYDRSVFPEGDICRDFCSTVGIPWHEGFEQPKADPNPSLSLDVAEIKRLFNAMPGYRGMDNFLGEAAIRASAQFPDPPGTSLFSPEEASQLLAHHAEGNRTLAERHFGGKSLFDDNTSGLIKWHREHARLREVAAALFADHGTMAATILLLSRELGRQRTDGKRRKILSCCAIRLAKGFANLRPPCPSGASAGKRKRAL